MSDLSIEYSLNTPVFNSFNSASNILNKKIFDLAKTGDLRGGGFGSNMNYSNCIVLLIGIIIIIVGSILLWFKNDLVETEANVISKNCDKNNNKCKINIKYQVAETQYSKIITIQESNIPNESIIKIYYSQSDPNSIQLYNPNYSMIGIGMILVGVFIMIFSFRNDNSSDVIIS